jgi:hypothetical protein
MSEKPDETSSDSGGDSTKRSEPASGPENVTSTEAVVSASDSAAEGGVLAGWYPDNESPGTERYWDGSKWTDQTRAVGTSTVKKTANERKAVLANQIQSAVAGGGRVESQSDFQAVIASGQPVNHTLHAILTVFTCLIWGIVWAIIAGTGGVRRQMIVVDEFGNATVQQMGKSKA